MKRVGVPVIFDPDLVRAHGGPYIEEQSGQLCMIVASWEDVDKLSDEVFLKQAKIAN